LAAPRARRGRQRGGRAVGEDEPGRGALVGGTHPPAAATLLHALGFGEGARWAAGTRWWAARAEWALTGGDRGRLVGLGCGVGFSLFFPISLFPLLSILNLALAFKFKINMLCEFKWRHNNSKHHTKLGAPACDATTIIPFGF
jgi:hypothetical protein